MVWYVRMINLVDGRQRWLQDGGGVLAYRTMREAAGAAAAQSRAEPLWHGCPVEIDPEAEEVYP